MQGKKFKVKSQGPKDADPPTVPDIDINFSDGDGDQPGMSDNPISWPKCQSDGAGDGFLTSIKGLFSSQRHRAKKLVLRTMGGGPENEFRGECGGSDVEFSPFARQLTVTKARKLIRRHTKKYSSKGRKRLGSTSQKKRSHPSSPTEATPCQSDSFGALLPTQEFQT